MVYVEDVAEAFAAAVDAELDSAEGHNLVGEVTTIDAFVGELEHQVPGARITASGAPLLIASDLEIAPQPAWLAGLPQTGVADGIARTLTHYGKLV